MTVRLSTVGRVFGFLTLAVATAGPAARPAPAVVPTVSKSAAVAERYYPEVRLRKLHLVRPDLIPFPLDFDVYC